MATKGEGVRETFRELLRAPTARSTQRHEFATKFGVSEEDFLKGVLRNFVREPLAGTRAASATPAV